MVLRPLSLSSTLLHFLDREWTQNDCVKWSAITCIGRWVILRGAYQMDEPGVGGCGRSVAIGLYRCLVTEERRGGRLLNARRAKPARWVNARGRHRAVFYSLAFPVQRTPSRILRGHALKIITDGRVEEERESILGGSSDSRHSIPFTPSSRLALAYIRFDYASRRFSPRGCALSTVHCHRNRDLDCSRGVLKIVERLVLHIMASSRSFRFSFCEAIAANMVVEI